MRDDLSRDLLDPEVLLDLDEVSLVFISGFVISLLDSALMLKAFLISGSDLSITVFLTLQRGNRWLVLVAERVVGRFHE